MEKYALSSTKKGIVRIFDDWVKYHISFEKSLLYLVLTLGNVINFLFDAVGLIQDHFAFNKIIPIYASTCIMIKIRILIKLNTNLTKIIVLYILFMSISFYQGCP